MVNLLDYIDVNLMGRMQILLRMKTNSPTGQCRD
jgi:hypothetical protein